MNKKFLAMASMYAAMGSMIPGMDSAYSSSPHVYNKTVLTKKQKKARAKSKNAKQARRK